MSERLGDTIRGAGFDAWGDEVCALGRQLADAKSAVAYGNSEIEKLLELVLEKDREIERLRLVIECNQALMNDVLYMWRVGRK